MKYVDEYRDRAVVQRYTAAIARAATRPWTIMEICGGQTHAIVRFGIDELLPPGITLVHGPGCPVCVTPVELIDAAIDIAGRPGVTLCSFGDMLRVPGSGGDLLAAKAAGADVRIVYSPLDAVRFARDLPDRQVVFFAVGFETTAPANAMAVYQAARQGLANFSALMAHVCVPPAMRALLSSPACVVQGFLAAGHVCTVMGTAEYEPLVAQHGVPIVVTGFEPLDILQGLLMCIRQLEIGQAAVEVQYGRSVRPEGNPAARAIMAEVFEVVDRRWRGLGEIAASGLGLRPAYAAHDALLRFDLAGRRVEESTICISGLILQGVRTPHECPAFGVACTPERPLGAPMVSSEGACAAYYRYRRRPSGEAGGHRALLVAATAPTSAGVP
ncbi:MAG: hydrogenase formation protein HypD [Chloroflexi bacterium]|nr:hydrogenase formation protein HypD [Chloroflexota bacterium]